MAFKHKPLDKYKTDINLADFILQPRYGFTKSKDSSPHSPKVERINNEGMKEELYVIKKNDKGFFTYWSPYDDSLNGKTIIDFVQEHNIGKDGQHYHLGKVRKFLDDYMRGNTFIPTRKSEFQITTYQKENDKFKIDIKNCTPYNDRTYLHQRGIKDTTIDNPMFKDTIKNKIFEHNNISYTNTAYLMVNMNGIGAINIKNKSNDKSFSGCLGNRAGSLVLSKIMNKEPLDKLIITESFDDALSHYQMNEKEYKNLNIRYTSTAGSLCEEQIHLIEEVIRKQKPKEFVLGFDNDISGKFYRAQLIGKLQVSNEISTKDFLEESKSFAYAHIDCKRANKIAYVDFVFSNKNKVEGVENITKLKGFIDIYNVKHKDTNFKGEPFKFTVKLADDNKAISQISFRNLSDNWQIVGDLIAEVKYEKGVFFKQEIPNRKDFNEDLIVSIENKYVKNIK